MFDHLKPRAVSPGALIGIVAPAGAVAEETLQAGRTRLHDWGYRTMVGPRILARHGYLAGTDAERAADFNEVWANPEVDAIICAKGGYGVMRMLGGIDWAMVRQNPKFFCGFSDITALHLAFDREANLVTFHGPMVAAFGGAKAFNAAGLRRALESAEPLGVIPWPEPVDDEAPRPVALRPGVAEGPIIGGNLSLLAGMVGTPWAPNFAGRIVLIEDIDEDPYRMDRMLLQLRQSGSLTGAAGILFGDSPSCMDSRDGKPSLTLLQVIEDHLGDLGIPILYGFPCGHTAYRATIPFGVRARLDATAGTLTMLEAALNR